MQRNETYPGGRATHLKEEEFCSRKKLRHLPTPSAGSEKKKKETRAAGTLSRKRVDEPKLW